MPRTEKQKKDGQAIIYIAAAVPGLLISLGIAYLRMRKRAKKEARRFFLTLVRDGVPVPQAKELADIYASSISLTEMIREMGPFTS
ncbi:MAG TPA: hypothetical protein PLC39_03430 [Methanomassiliicoccales archaeon]|nr:hypothetical protein [Methanomassiliicoccales archaeon]HPR98331.1 hypothetical protein [Methanomassiliicoccales archaeon]